MASVNLLRGRPGAGKGYEGVAYHIIPAVKSGRKVITNMQLNVDHFCIVYGEQCRDLIECRPDRVKDEGRWAFSSVDDFDSEWRHPETNQGPLYVIDECHKPFRKGDQLREVEEWFAEVRHTGANVLLMTQGTRKVNPNILDLVQVTYLVSKVPGDEGSYYRKVIDGLRGQAMNSDTRSYESWVYPFYKSHTKSDSSVSEMVSLDVKSLKSHFIFKLRWVFLLFAISSFGFAIYNVVSDDEVAEDDISTEQDTPSEVSKPKNDFQALQAKFDGVPDPVESDPVPLELEQSNELDPELAEQQFEGFEDSSPSISDHPFKGFSMAVKGSVKFKGKDTYLISFGRQGQQAFALSSDQLIASGYTVEPMGECLMLLTYKDDYQDYLTCSYHVISVKSTMTGS